MICKQGHLNRGNMMSKQKMIVTAAVNGSVPTKEDTPHVPITPEEVVQDAVQCWEAGASVVHIHARREDGGQSHDREYFRRCLEGISDECDIIVQFSTGARKPVPAETRIQSIDLHPEMMSVNCGCCNFPQGPFINSMQDIEYWLTEMKKSGVKPELECFDLSHVYAAAELYDRGLIPDPPLFNLIFGAKGALPFTPQNFIHMHECVPEGALINVIGVGRHQLPVTVMSTVLGNNVRVGLEDNIFYSYGVKATNRQLVERAVRIAEECQREVAAPDEARVILGIGN